MVEVVGTAPTSAMFITKFVYRCSWKTNMNNIKLYLKDSIYLFEMALSEQQKKEISEQQAQKNTTKRVTSHELEKILYGALPVLDHGFIRVVDYMLYDNYIPQIDGLRAIAVLSVILFHANFKILNINFAGGYFGVDIFFVI